MSIFLDLQDDNLLSRCLEGIRQNPNEAFNQIVWEKSAKYIFISRDVLEIAVASAVVNFNDGVIELSNISVTWFIIRKILSRRGTKQRHQ